MNASELGEACSVALRVFLERFSINLGNDDAYNAALNFADEIIANSEDRHPFSHNPDDYDDFVQSFMFTYGYPMDDETP